MLQMIGEDQDQESRMKEKINEILKKDQKVAER
jgi:hypothetical protein